MKNSSACVTDVKEFELLSKQTTDNRSCATVGVTTHLKILKCCKL